MVTVVSNLLRDSRNQLRGGNNRHTVSPGGNNRQHLLRVGRLCWRATHWLSRWREDLALAELKMRSALWLAVVTRQQPIADEIGGASSNWPFQIPWVDWMLSCICEGIDGTRQWYTPASSLPASVWPWSDVTLLSSCQRFNCMGIYFHDSKAVLGLNLHGDLFKGEKIWRPGCLSVLYK